MGMTSGSVLASGSGGATSTWHPIRRTGGKVRCVTHPFDSVGNQWPDPCLSKQAVQQPCTGSFNQQYWGSRCAGHEPLAGRRRRRLTCDSTWKPSTRPSKNRTSIIVFLTTPQAHRAMKLPGEGFVRCSGHRKPNANLSWCRPGPSGLHSDGNCPTCEAPEVEGGSCASEIAQAIECRSPQPTSKPSFFQDRSEVGARGVASRAHRVSRSLPRLGRGGRHGAVQY